MVAKNRCARCGHDWQDRPMGFAIHQACPACGSVYWEWRNYGEAGEARRHTPSVSLARDEEPPR